MGFLFAILIGVILLIVYGSLYPWTFVARPLFASPFYLLLHSWEYDPLSRRYWADIPVNIAIYIPLGMAGFLALRRYRSRLAAIAGPVALGAILSASIEMIQLYVPGRHCSTLDLTMNILGSALGVVLGLLRSWRSPICLPRDPISTCAIATLSRCCSAGSPSCCFLFSLRFRSPRCAIKSRSSCTAVCSTAPGLRSQRGRMVRRGTTAQVAAGARVPVAWLAALFALAVPLQFILLGHNPLPSDFAGPLLAMLIFLLCRRAPWADCAAGIALLIAVVIRALTPFRFTAAGQPFLWIPFAGFLQNSWQTSVSILLGKLFQYGASIWLLSRALFGVLGATVVIAVILAIIETLQTLSTAHVPEITDPLLALLLGLAFSVLRSDA